jgi:hypothetical protein
MKKYLVFALALLLAFGFPIGARAGTLYDDGEIVIDSTNLYPKTDGGSTLGKSSYEFAGLYVDSITLGGVAKTSWGSVISPITDASGYVNPTDAGSYVRLYDTGYLRLGDATNAGDYYVLFTGDSDAWYAGQDDTTNDFQIGYGSTIGTTERLSIVDSNTVTTIQVGDSTEYDMQINFLGNAQTFHIGLDDTADDLIIGLGTALGTTTAIGIDENLAIATYGDIVMGGTTPTLTVGDAGAEDAKIVFDGASHDFHIGLGNAADDLFIGVGSTLATTPAISITDALAITTYAGITMTGTTPLLTVGDGGTEDNAVYFNGVTDFAIGVDHTASVFEICNGANLDATCALSIDANEDIILPAGSLYIIDDEYIYFGTNSNWTVEYDETVDDQLIFLTAGTTATATTDPLFEIIVGATPTEDQQVFGVSKGTQASNTSLLALDEDGDLTIAGTFSSSGVSAATDTFTLTGTSPTFVIGDGGADDNQVTFDGQSTKDFAIGTDATDDTLVICYGSALGTDNRLAINDDADTTLVTIGDGQAGYDKYFLFDGASTADFYVGIDDTGGAAEDLFTIGYGSAVGTTPILSIGSTGTVILTATSAITAANIVDVESSIQFTVDDFAIGSDGADMITLSDSTSPGLEVDNNLPAIVWADGETSHIKVTFKIPADYASGGAFRAFIDTTDDSAETQLDWKYTKTESGGTWDATPTEETAISKHAPYGAGAGTPTTVTLTPTAAGWAVSAGDIVTVTLWRTDDTASTSDLELYYLDFYYTATQ